MLANTIERDARNDGWKAGIAQGLAEGKSLGLAEGKSLGLAEGEARGRSEGSHQKALQDASNFKRLGVSVDIISQATGLSLKEVEALN